MKMIGLTIALCSVFTLRSASTKVDCDKLSQDIMLKIHSLPRPQCYWSSNWGGDFVNVRDGSTTSICAGADKKTLEKVSQSLREFNTYRSAIMRCAPKKGSTSATENVFKFIDAQARTMEHCLLQNDEYAANKVEGEE